MNEKQIEPTIESELVDELIETVATLTRLGVTLASLPMTLLPEKERRQLTQLTSEAWRVGASLPRAIGGMLENTADEWQGNKNPREDLGSRLRREKLKAEEGAS
jgi:hypothetical protein